MHESKISSHKNTDLEGNMEALADAIRFIRNPNHPRDQKKLVTENLISYEYALIKEVLPAVAKRRFICGYGSTFLVTFTAMVALGEGDFWRYGLRSGLAVYAMIAIVMAIVARHTGSRWKCPWFYAGAAAFIDLKIVNDIIASTHRAAAAIGLLVGLTMAAIIAFAIKKESDTIRITNNIICRQKRRRRKSGL